MLLGFLAVDAVWSSRYTLKTPLHSQPEGLSPGSVSQVDPSFFNLLFQAFLFQHQEKKLYTYMFGCQYSRLKIIIIYLGNEHIVNIDDTDYCTPVSGDDVKGRTQ